MKNQSMISKSLEFIENHIDDELSLSGIASYMGYSDYHFARIFKNHMGISTMEYVKKIRLAKASDAIMSGKSIIDVALDSGYQSHSGFCKAFKKEFGFSPSFFKIMIVQTEFLGGKAMDHIFYKQIDNYVEKEKLVDLLRTEMKCHKIAYRDVELETVYQVACEAYSGIKRYSGEEYIIHPLNVAIILAEMEADDKTVYAGLLCDVLQRTEMKQSELHRRVPAKVEQIVVKLETCNHQRLNSLKDEEVIMVKLAARLHNMRTIKFIEKGGQEKKAQETIQLFLPLAHRLKNKKLVAELNDLSHRYLE